jgi:hypothetical protein
VLGWRRCCRCLPMVGVAQPTRRTCGDRIVAGSNPARPTIRGSSVHVFCRSGEFWSDGFGRSVEVWRGCLLNGIYWLCFGSLDVSPSPRVPFSGGSCFGLCLNGFAGFGFWSVWIGGFCWCSVQRAIQLEVCIVRLGFRVFSEGFWCGCLFDESENVVVDCL